MKTYFILFLLIFVSCDKSDIAIGLEGDYDVEVNVIKRSWLTTKNNSTDQIHGIYISGDSVMYVEAFAYTTELRIFKHQGKFYMHNMNITSMQHYPSLFGQIPLSIERDEIIFTTPKGDSNNGNPFFDFRIDKSKLEGKWIKGYNIIRYSIPDIKNGIIEQASIKLTKK